MESMGLGTLAENADNPGEVYDADFPVLYALPSPNSARSRILQYITYRAEGLDGKAIAERMGMKYATLRTMVYKASKEGWLKFTDPTERFQNQIVPKVVDNIEHWIDKKDKTMTIEAAKGSGIFKNYQAIKVEGQAPMTVLALKIEPAPGGNAKVLTGHVVGVPKAIEGEVTGG
jgi:transposase